MQRSLKLAAALCGVVASVALDAGAQPRSPEADPPPAPQEPAPSAPSQAGPAEAKTASRPPVKADQARNYEVPPGTEPEDVALFVPRVVLAVPRYALKIVFFPIRETIRFVDEHALIEKAEDVLYNDARTAAILPTLSIDSSLGPTVGVKAFHEDLAGHDEYASAEAKFGGMYTLATQLHFRADRFRGSRLWLESVARYESEPGMLFQGIGHGAPDIAGNGYGPREVAVATRFSQQRLLNLQRAGVSFGQPGEMLKVGATSIYSVRDFGVKQRGSDPSIEEVYDTSQLNGFADSVPTLETDLNLIVDLRDVAGATASGGYLELFGGYVPRIGNYSFWHHGAEVTGYIDLYKRTRVLILRAVVEGVEGAEQDIPFAELPRLGGPHRLRGYPLDRFRDEKAVVGTVEYRYPIHQYVAGALFVDAGRVERSYGDFLDEHWKVGAGGGFVFRSRDRQLFSFQVAYGGGVQFHLTTDPLRAFSKRETEL